MSENDELLKHLLQQAVSTERISRMGRDIRDIYKRLDTLEENGGYNKATIEGIRERVHGLEVDIKGMLMESKDSDRKFLWIIPEWILQNTAGKLAVILIFVLAILFGLGGVLTLFPAIKAALGLGG